MPVTTMASTAHEEYLSDQGTWIGVHVKSRAEESLFRRTAPWCWVITWKFSARELSMTKPAPSCTQITCHGPFRCEASKLESEPRAGPGSQEDLELVSQSPAALIRTKSRTRRTTGRVLEEKKSNGRTHLKCI